ncbi:MAG: aminotransferase class I/II-fold pyridoxal phosphate-dependent enzyme, partial [Rikenellaceae bacterium]
MIHGHGDDIHSYKGKMRINFSSNVYSHIDHAGLENHLISSFGQLRSYPEPEGESLKKIIAGIYGIVESQIVVTNGATEAIYLIANAYRGKTSAILSPTFSEYSDACKLFNHKVKHIKSLEETESGDDIIWLCNPNNPTGSVLDKTLLGNYINRFADKLFIIDQSYESFTKKEIFDKKEASSFSNLIIINSLTKKYAIPGLRIGYFFTVNEILAKQIKKFCMPWSVNSLAIEAAKYLISQKYPLFNLTTLLEETSRLRDEINKIDGITAFPTDTHFFLCKTEKDSSHKLKKYLMENHGILIRDA